MSISREQALAHARVAMEQSGWTWKEPTTVQCRRRGFFERRFTYEIRTNVGMLGCNGRIVIDAESGEILQAGWLPR